MVFEPGCGDDQTPSRDDNNTAEEPAKTPTAVMVDKPISGLDENTLKAAEKYECKYVDLTGELNGIDASRDYFNLYPSNDDWAFTGVQCDI